MLDMTINDFFESRIWHLFSIKNTSPAQILIKNAKPAIDVALMIKLRWFMFSIAKREMNSPP
jgi:hypothetical protein